MTTQNTTVIIARENQSKLFTTQDDSQLKPWAWQNECDIEATAQNLESNLNSAANRIREAAEFLNDGNISCLNSCGIVQQLNTEIDSGVMKLQTLIKNRKMYRDILNS